jgi:predicted MPP superfamily phosphohydrolase
VKYKALKHIKLKIVIIGALFAAFLFYGFFENQWLKVNSFDFQSNNIPEAFSGKKIVFLSDLHLGFYFSNQRTAKLVETINQLEPDIIIFGGDFIDRNVKYTEPRFDGLKDLKARLGKFGVLGNHDNVINANLIKREMQEAGITFLDNKAEWIQIGNQKIKIGGVGDLWTSWQNLEPTVADVGKDDFVILVSHNPDYAPKIKNDLIDLVLSGHTHAGQVTFFGLGAIMRSKYGQKFRYGLVDLGNTKVYITSGVGSTVAPIRFFARPEIVLVTLKK